MTGFASGALYLVPRCAKLLLEAGATVNLAARDSEVTPLHVAAARGLEGHVALYLEHGADVNLRTSQGETALNAACAGAEGPSSSRRHQAAARRLLEAGADARAAGRKRHTPLHNACANGCGGLAELLLRHGACAAVPNGAGQTPMDCALQAVQDAPNWEPEVLFAALLDYGAQPVRPEVRGSWRAGVPGTGIAQLPGKRSQKIEPIVYARGRSPSREGPTRVREESVQQRKKPPRRLEHT